MRGHYGSSKDRTVLRIFSERAGSQEPILHSELRDQDAYDAWHLSLYFKELLETRRLIKSGARGFDAITRKEKNALVYLLLAANPDLMRVTELGSSICELIDGLELSRQCLSEVPPLDVKGLAFLGIELSSLLIQAACELHHGYDIVHVHDAAEFAGSLGLLYDRSVSNYAFETAAEFAELLNRSELAFMNAFFSFGDTFESQRLGKQLTYFSLNETIARLDKPLFHLFGERAPGARSSFDISLGRPVIEGFFVAGERARVEAMLKLADRDDAAKRWFVERNIRIRPAEELTSR